VKSAYTDLTFALRKRLTANGFYGPCRIPRTSFHERLQDPLADRLYWRLRNVLRAL
jgi:hypothetical protein